MPTLLQCLRLPTRRPKRPPRRLNPWRSSCIGGALILVALCACARLPSPQERYQHATALLASKSWSAHTVDAGTFRVAAFFPAPREPSALLTVYLEGDGLAWVANDIPSQDPTPANPVALRLALSQPDGAAAYLARPCQFQTGGHDPACGDSYWTGKRFSDEVVASTGMALDHVKKIFGASRLQLVGYSGGGAVAALVAAGRNDVVRIITVAGNLDTAAWVRHHGVTPLQGSRNPADAAARLKDIRQILFVGGNDAIVPADIAIAYASRFPPSDRPEIRTIGGFDHVCCWAEQWPRLWRTLDK